MIEVGQDEDCAIIGNIMMERTENEPVPAFRERARDFALDLGADILVFAPPPLVWIDDRLNA
jgi:hypothetical protein